jgi:hypothetical protein
MLAARYATDCNLPRSNATTGATTHVVCSHRSPLVLSWQYLSVNCKITLAILDKSPTWLWPCLGKCRVNMAAAETTWVHPARKSRS